MIAIVLTVAPALVLCYLLARERFGRGAGRLAIAGVAAGIARALVRERAGRPGRNGPASWRARSWPMAGSGARGAVDPGVGPRGCSASAGRARGGDALDGRPVRRRLRPRRRALVVHEAGCWRRRRRSTWGARPVALWRVDRAHRRRRPGAAGAHDAARVVHAYLVVGGVAVAGRLPRADALLRLRRRRRSSTRRRGPSPPPRARRRRAAGAARGLERHADEGRRRTASFDLGDPASFGDVGGGAGPGPARLDRPSGVGAGQHRLRHGQRRAPRRLRHPGLEPAAGRRRQRRRDRHRRRATGRSSARAGTAPSRTAARPSAGRPARRPSMCPLDHAADLVVQVDRPALPAAERPPQQLTLVVNGVAAGPVTPGAGLAPGDRGPSPAPPGAVA